MEKDAKYDADSGNDSTNEMLQKEKLIDPGNEHTHHNQADDKIPGEDEKVPKKKDTNANEATSHRS